MTYKIYAITHNFAQWQATRYEVRSASRPAPANSKLIRWNLKSYDTAKESLNKYIDKGEWEFIHTCRLLGEKEPVTAVYTAHSRSDYINIMNFLHRKRLVPILKSDNMPGIEVMTSGEYKIARFAQFLDEVFAA